MARHRRFAALLALALVPSLTSACTDAGPGEQSLDAQEDGILSRMFGTLTDFFGSKAEQDHAIAPAEPWTPPGDVEDPAVDELFETMGLVEVKPDEDPSYDGALVGHYEHFPDENDPDDFYDDVCFFAQAPDDMPSHETLFWAEMYGFRPDHGVVSDVHGKPIEMECVGCAEGNTGGGETRVIFYVNGIRTDTDTHCETLQEIANQTGAVTIGILNETEGWVKDVWQTAWDRFTVQIENQLTDWGIDKTLRIHQNRAARMLANVVVQRVRQGKRVEIWAHSQGGAVTSLALHRALRALAAEGLYPVRDGAGEEVPDAIRVVTFGSAASQWPEGLWPKGPTYVHYVHRRDATPSALGVGALGDYLTLGKPRAGGDAEMVFFDGEPPDLEEAEDPAFDVIDAAIANVAFEELEAEAYHDVTACYLPMHRQRHGVWSP